MVSSQSGPGFNFKVVVKLRGVEIGKVGSAAFDPRVAGQILVGIEVARTAPVTVTTVAQLGLQGITGLSFIELSDEAGPEPPTVRPVGDRIAQKPSLIDQLSRGECLPACRATPP